MVEVQISRSDFTEAIEVGIKNKRGLNPHPAESKRLRDFAKTAKKVGETFSSRPGCPLKQLGICDSGGHGPDWSSAFTDDYDDYLCELRINQFKDQDKPPIYDRVVFIISP